MSRSVSAPSSVTKTSPCWNGLIVPGSTLRYGSNFCSCTRSPRAFSRRPSDAATMPFPSAETTPPVTKTYFGARALTGFQGSSGGGRIGFPASAAAAAWNTSWSCPGSDPRQWPDHRAIPPALSHSRARRASRMRGSARRSGRGLRLLPGAKERVEPQERAPGIRAPETDQPRTVDEERHLRPLLVERLKRELRVDPVARELERDPLHGLDVEDEQRPRRERLAEPVGAVRPDDLPARARGEPAAVRLDAGDVRPPVGEVVRLREEPPDVLDRREDDLVRDLPRQRGRGTRTRRASARARPCAPRRRAGRSACVLDHLEPSRRESGGLRARRSAAGA